MKRVLLTGASGFIGRHCLAPLHRAGYEVHAVARQPLPADPACPATWHQADLLDPAGPGRLVAAIAPSHLLHLAWIATPGEFWTAPQNLDWVEASVRLLREFARQGGRRVVMAGTCAELDWANLPPACGDETPCRPATLYGACKNALRQILHAHARQAGLSAAWGRVFFLYGPHEHPRRLVPAVIASLLRGQPVPCTHGRQKRDFLHVQDGADAFTALLDSDVQGDLDLGTGEGRAVKEVVTCLAEALQGTDLIRWGAVPLPAHEPPLIQADERRLLREVGFTPRWKLAQGLVETIAWWRKELGDPGKRRLPGKAA
jgi:nucleoside-diphosphate-sugar epimerase